MCFLLFSRVSGYHLNTMSGCFFAVFSVCVFWVFVFNGVLTSEYHTNLYNDTVNKIATDKTCSYVAAGL